LRKKITQEQIVYPKSLVGGRTAKKTISFVVRRSGRKDRGGTCEAAGGESSKRETVGGGGKEGKGMESAAPMKYFNVGIGMLLIRKKNGKERKILEASFRRDV